MLHWKGETGIGRKSFGAFARIPEASSVADVIDLDGRLHDVRAGCGIFAEDDACRLRLQGASAARVRFSKLMSDGRRQIGAFYLPGDIFGLEAEDAHTFSAEAIGQSQILVVKRSAFLAEAMRDPDAARQLWTQTLEHSAARAGPHAASRPQERAGADRRLPARNGRPAAHPADRVELPMSRQDIADYLGLTIETVSRTLTQLERGGVIAIPASRRIIAPQPRRARRDERLPGRLKASRPKWERG